VLGGGLGSLLAALIATTASGQLYVDAASTAPAPNGSTWSLAYPTLEQALIAASPTTSTDIFVAGSASPYLPTAEMVTGSPRTKSFLLTKKVRIYGGFLAGTGGQSFERNPMTHVTTLSGDLTGNASQRAAHVVFMRRVGTDTRLDGMTVTAGRADLVDGAPASFINGEGGGIVCSSLGSDGTVGLTEPVIQNCVVSGDFAQIAGGGISSHGKDHADPDGKSTPSIRDCAMSNNQVDGLGRYTGDGGGIYAQGGTVQLVNRVIDGNSATGQGGGALAIGSGAFVAHNCTIVKNSVSPSSMMLKVAGVFTQDDSGLPDALQSWFVNCIFWANDDSNSIDDPTLLEQASGAGGNPQLDLKIYYSFLQGVSGASPIHNNFELSTGPGFAVNDPFYRLAVGSPCRDSGSSNPASGTLVDDFPPDTFDADNDALLTEPTPDRIRRIRIVAPAGGAAVIDSGAIEFRCIGDINGDGVIDGFDLGSLGGEWGDPKWNSPADFNFDDRVNGFDLTFLLTHWGWCEEEAGYDGTGSVAAMMSSPGAGEEDVSIESTIEMLGFASVPEFAEWFVSLDSEKQNSIVAFLTGG